MLRENHVSRLLTSDNIIVCRHVVIDILVAHSGFCVVDTEFVERLKETYVRHNRSHYRIIIQLVALLEVCRRDVENLIAVHHVSEFINAQTAVGIAVVCETNIQSLFHNELLQSLNMRTARIAIDIRAIRFGIHHISLCSERIKHRSRNVPSASVGTVQTYLHPLKGMNAEGYQITDITIATLDIIYRTANRILRSVRRNSRLAVQEILNARDGCIIHLLAIAVDEFNAVIVIRIVARRNHDTTIKTVTLSDVGHGRSCRYVQEVSVGARRGNPCGKRVFQHVRRATCVLTNYDAPTAIGSTEVPTEEASYFKSMFRGEIHICLAAKAVCSEIFTHKFLFLEYKVQSTEYSCHPEHKPHGVVLCTQSVVRCQLYSVLCTLYS